MEDTEAASVNADDMDQQAEESALEHPALEQPIVESAEEPALDVAEQQPLFAEAAEQPADDVQPCSEQQREAEPDADHRDSALAAVVSALDEDESEDQPVAEEAHSEPVNPAPEFVIPESEAVPGSRRVIVPFALYAAAWLGLAAATYLLLRTAADPLGVGEYAYLVWAGVGLAAASPLVVVWAWLTARGRAEDSEARKGLLARAMLLTSIVVALGVLAWWGALLAVDAARGAL